ncbi:hypothetical protein P4C99_18515 [Pontiellaceae bacterium B1224]|nr:hypothetical protein [Pontiellaceae bacterium B1224]
MKIKPGSFWVATLVVLLRGLASAGLADDTGTQLDVSNAEQLSKTLSDTFNRQGSFQAEYQAIGPTNSMGFGLLLNKELEFVLMKMIKEGETSTIVYTINDFSEDGLTFLATDGTTGIKINYRSCFQTILESFKRPDNPAGWFVFIAKSFAEESKVEVRDASSPKKLLTTINLGLSADGLNAGVGNSSNGFNSWLAPELLTNAVSIVEYDDSIQFFFKNSHTVLIDKNSGLLLEDSFPSPDKLYPRAITRIHRGELEVGGHYSTLIPGFDQIEFKEVDPNSSQMKKQMSREFLTALGRSLGETEGLEKLLEKYAERIEDRTREAGRAAAQEVFIDNIPLKYIEVFGATVLAEYEKYEVSVPDTETPVSFSLFVDALQLEMAKRPGVAATIADKFNAEFCQKCQSLLAGLPADARAPLQMLYDQIMPSFVEGVSEEIIQWFFEQIKMTNGEVDSPAID